jgi:protein phosphatase
MITIPDPSLLVLTGGEVSSLRRAAEVLLSPSELCDSSAMTRARVLADVDRRLRARRFVAVLDAGDDAELRAELRAVGRRHCLPRLVLAFGDARVDERLAAEGFRSRLIPPDLESLLAASPERGRLACDRRGERGPFDLIGDVHGCFEELLELLTGLGYSVAGSLAEGFRVDAPAGRRVIFLGDLVDRGPGVAEALGLALDMNEAGAALLLPGNHEEKLVRALGGADVRLSHGLDRSLDQLESQPGVAARYLALHSTLADHLLLDGGRLVAAHAGLEEAFHGRESRRVRGLALFGPTSGEVDAEGHPIRLDWSRLYRGAARVVYGHTPVSEARWVNRTINIDTGCVFGGSLTALRWPERELVSVPARGVHWPPADETQP